MRISNHRIRRFADRENQLDVAPPGVKAIKGRRVVAPPFPISVSVRFAGLAHSADRRPNT
jgi:hypothetical protein